LTTIDTRSGIRASTCALLCALLLSGCKETEGPRTTFEYALTWSCLSPEGCERAEELERVDRTEQVRREFHFTSTQDESFSEHAMQIASDSLPEHCSWLHELSFLGRDLEPSRLCFFAGGFELELSIPHEDATTQSRWLVEGLDVDLL
jgi:hypothetical protein